ncbi:MAG: hypothetical protein OXC19_25770 [Bryobacterales bacterium]|nr:hypothetical protein [Bryobacterales bacterium]
MRIKIAALTAVLLAGVAPGVAETFDRGQAAYRAAGGKWAKASIHVLPGTLEIHSPRGKRRQLVGRFSLAESGEGGKTVTIESQVNVRRRTAAGARLGIIGGAVVGGLWIGLKPGLTKIAESKGARPDDIRQVEEEYWDKYAPKVFGGLLGVVGVAAIVKGLSKARDPYWRISETSAQGTRSLEIRVSKKDIGRFEQVLVNNRLSP